MMRRGQVVVIVGFLIPVVLLLMAVGVDAGRIFLARAELQRAAEAAASSGISVVADRMVTQVAFRQTEVAQVAFATALPGSTPTGSFDLLGWLTEDDRATLVSPGVQAAAREQAQAILTQNGVDLSSPNGVDLEMTYPQSGYDPGSPEIRSLVFRVRLQTRLTVLLAGILGEQWTKIDVAGEAEIPQR